MQLPLENWAARAEDERVRPGKRPRVKLTALSAEDQERILKLIQERNRLARGPDYDSQRLSIGCKIYEIRNLGCRKTKEAKERHKNQSLDWSNRNRIRRREIGLQSYYRCRPPLKQRVLLMTPLAQRTRNRRKVDIRFVLSDRLRATLNRAFRRNWIRKPARTEALIGCTITEAKAHLEWQFANGMSWQDRASFVVDHIVPIVAFDLKASEEVHWAFNWRNLQPLTRHANAVKQAAIPSPLPSWLPVAIADRILRRMESK